MSNRYARAFGGWLAGCGAATVVILIMIAVMGSSGPGSLPFVQNILPTLILTIFVFPYTCVMSAIPALIIIWLAARLKIRSIGFFACAGAVAGVLSIGGFVGLNRSSWMFAVAGLAAGVTYWFVAGRYGGRDVSLREEQG